MLIFFVSGGFFVVQNIYAADSYWSITDDVIGGDCRQIGNWDAANKTCTLTTDVYQTIQIDSNNITLDGAGHLLSGVNSGNGIYIYRRSGIIVKNLNIKSFGTGIYIASSSNNIFMNNSANLNHYGIYFSYSNSNVLMENTINSNGQGVSLYISMYNILKNNIIQENDYQDIGIRMSYGSNAQCINFIENNIGSGNRPIKYFNSRVNLSNETLSELILCDADGSNINNVIVDGSVSKKNNGILLLNTNNSNFTNIKSTDNSYGIQLSESSNNNTFKNNILNSNNYGIWVGHSYSNFFESNIINSNNHGIILFGSSNNVINDNKISSSNYGIYPGSDSYKNKIYNNNFINNKERIYIYNVNMGNIFNLATPIGGNYWSDFDTPSEGCSDLNNDNFCDAPYFFRNGQDNLPWTKQDGWKISVNQPPTISNINQYKSDGIAVIAEGGTVMEESVVFKAILNDADNDQVKFQIELKEFNQAFDGQNILESDFVVSGGEVVVRRDSLTDGQYKWRARAIDSQGNAGDWQEFGTAGNVDFEVKLVPLYTQIRSEFPSDDETKIWTNIEYAKGFSENYGCGSTIAQCGCAITSIVMIAKYHLDQDIAQGKDINPKEINEWLNDELGGYVKGDVNWIAGAKYTGWKIKYAKTDNVINNYSLLDQYLNQNNPVIAKANAGRGGINRSHFFVINDKLSSTYAVKDPYWYNTENLIDDRIGNYIRNYENGFDGLRIYKKGDGIAQGAIIIVLGSPAELLITDSLGRKLGKDINGIEYNEIPNASYFEDGFDDPASENLSFQERNKLIQILEPADGNYQLQVTGTGEGDYSLDYNFYDIQGSNNHQKFQSETAPGYIAQYNFSFDSENSVNAIVELFDEIPPEAEIFFNQNTQQLEIKGIDNTTVNSILSVVENEKEKIYQIQDEAGNMIKLYFGKLKQEGKQIKVRLNGIQYNDNPIIEMGADLKYEWSENKDGVVKELNQHILAKDIFDIKAKYNYQKNETELIVKQENQEEIEQTLPEFVIIKLVTKSGVLNFEY